MSRRLIDLRSDSKTRPSPKMREAMACAEVGDDTDGSEDPTVNALLERVAAMFEKEAGLYVSSGTQANQIAIKVYTQPGDEIVADDFCHPFLNELAAGAIISGVQYALIAADRGVYSRKQAEEHLRPEGPWQPRSALLWVENTHNRGGGNVFPLEKLDELRALSLENQIPLYIDGARIFNAIVASGVSAHEWGRRCDSLCIGTSKGLACPVGSVLLGTQDFIQKARRIRKILGGGWRQAGILAAAGIYALDHNIERLAEDHANAQRFAELTSGIPHVRLVHETTPTNLAFLDVSDTGKSAAEVKAHMMEHDVALSVTGPTELRAATHLDVSRDDMDQAAETLSEAVA